MTQSVVNKKTRDSYTEAMCDGCRATCPESRQKGARGDAISSAAHRAAIEAGWVEKDVRERKSPRSRFVTYVQLLCPRCQAEGEAKS